MGTRAQFQLLIVVTSNWHMPRAMAELEHQLPDVTLIAYPVISEKAKAEPWCRMRTLRGCYFLNT